MLQQMIVNIYESMYGIIILYYTYKLKLDRRKTV